MTARMRTCGRSVAIVVGVALGLVAATLPGDATAVPRGRVATSQPQGGSAERGAAAAATPSKAGWHSFSSPSRNIGCYLNRRYARCDIARHTWHAPPRPPSCQFDWGNGLFVRRASHWVCASDTVLGARRVLDYGYYVRFGHMKCVSRRTGMTCRNLHTRHGFRLARDSYSRF